MKYVVTAAVVVGLWGGTLVQLAGAAGRGGSPHSEAQHYNAPGAHPAPQHVSSFSQPAQPSGRPDGAAGHPTFARPENATPERASGAPPAGFVPGRANLPPRHTFYKPITPPPGERLAPPGQPVPALPGNVGNRPAVNPRINNTVVADPTFGGWSYARQRYGNWYHGSWHGNWAPSWSTYPLGWGYGYGGYGGLGGYAGYGPNYAGFNQYGMGYGYGPYATTGYALTGLAASGLINAASPWSWGYYGYSNPYYAAENTGGWTGYNYSQPLALAAPPLQAARTSAGTTAIANEQAAQQPPSDAAIATFDAARDAFRQGDYPTALKLVDQAIGTAPGDPVMHEFRALCLFAMGNYQQAATALYAVLSVGPGWDWTTVANLYPNVDVYTQQLRALEAYRQQHPDVPQARFVLAYHYLLQGYTDAAAAELRAVVKLQPSNQLAAQLLASINTPNAALVATGPPPKPIAAAVAAGPLQPSLLVGNWSAVGPDGAQFGLALTNDSKFAWQCTRDGKTTKITGTYKLQDEIPPYREARDPRRILVLQAADNNNLVGSVALLPHDKMNFKLAGENPSDQGLTFTR